MKNNKEKKTKRRINLYIESDVYSDAQENIGNISKFINNVLIDYLDSIDKEHELKRKINEKKNQINELQMELDYLQQQLNELKEIEKDKGLKEQRLNEAINTVKRVDSNENLTKERITAIAKSYELKPYVLRKKINHLKDIGELDITIHKRGSENIDHTRDKTPEPKTRIMDTTVYGKLKKEYNNANSRYRSISSKDKTRKDFIEQLKKNEQKVKRFESFVEHHNKTASEQDKLTLDLLFEQFLKDDKDIKELHEKESMNKSRISTLKNQEKN